MYGQIVRVTPDRLVVRCGIPDAISVDPIIALLLADQRLPPERTADDVTAAHGTIMDRLMGPPALVRLATSLSCSTSSSLELDFRLPIPRATGSTLSLPQTVSSRSSMPSTSYSSMGAIPV